MSLSQSANYIKNKYKLDLTENEIINGINKMIENFYFYELKNMENLIYHEKFTAVKSKKMVSCITVFRDGDNWVLYAIGGVDVPKLWFLKDRIETSFMNRIKTFCNFIFSKI